MMGQKGPKHVGLVFYDIIVIVILTKLCAFVGLNCNNSIIMHGLEKAKIQSVLFQIHLCFMPTPQKIHII